MESSPPVAWLEGVADLVALICCEAQPEAVAAFWFWCLFGAALWELGGFWGWLPELWFALGWQLL